MKTPKDLPRLLALLAMALIAFFAGAARVHAGGTLTPLGSGAAPLEIRSHDVSVVLNNGFAQTTVTQTFHNPNATPVEGIYAFPVPPEASLGDVRIELGERTIRGEVLPKAEADKAYNEEKSSGNDTGLASQETDRNYQFHIAPIPAASDVRLSFTYYQPLRIDTGIGRYVYPLENGGTEDAAQSFWSENSTVSGTFSVNLELKSAVPVTDVRAPGLESAAHIERVDDGHYRLTMTQQGAKLGRDFVFYYRLASDLPGRVEVLPYRASADKPGTFMIVVTPGTDLAPIQGGADYSFVLDVSGSMKDKLPTLCDGVIKAIGQLKPEDRFRLITFNNEALELAHWTTATPANVQAVVGQVKALRADGGTNLDAGLHAGLSGLDPDRATSLVLVTDGVANVGEVSPLAMHRLLRQYDLRFFGFLLGNNANWPLMRALADASGGFYTGVSNADDISGQLALAKSKMAYEAMHDVDVRIAGDSIRDVTGTLPRKLFRGEQLVILGRYSDTGRASLTLKTRITGEDKVYTSVFELPAVDTANPEIERLWALAAIDQLELQKSIGLLPAEEVSEGVTQLGVDYSLVTDETSMVLMSDASFARRGIERRNLDRTTREDAAQTIRATQPARPTQVDKAQPTFGSQPAPHVSKPSGGYHGGGGGGGAIGPGECVIGAVTLLSLGLAARRNRRRRATLAEPGTR